MAQVFDLVSSCFILVKINSPHFFSVYTCGLLVNHSLCIYGCILPPFFVSLFVLSSVFRVSWSCLPAALSCISCLCPCVILTVISVRDTLNLWPADNRSCFSTLLWVRNAAMAYGCDVTSQPSFWLVTTLTDFLAPSLKPAHRPVFPFRPVTVTQTWLCVWALTRTHINTISCGAESNARTHRYTSAKSIHAASSKCFVWHQIRSHSIGSPQSWPETDGFNRRTVNRRRCRHSRCACVAGSTQLHVFCFASGEWWHVFPSLCITDTSECFWCDCPNCLGVMNCACSASYCSSTCEIPVSLLKLRIGR